MKRPARIFLVRKHPFDMATSLRLSEHGTEGIGHGEPGRVRSRGTGRCRTLDVADVTAPSLATSDVLSGRSDPPAQEGSRGGAESRGSQEGLRPSSSPGPGPRSGSSRARSRLPRDRARGLAIAAALTRAGWPRPGGLRPDGPGPPGGPGPVCRPPGRRQGWHPISVPANAVDKVCLSGLNTIYLADQMIRSGDGRDHSSQRG